MIRLMVMIVFVGIFTVTAKANEAQQQASNTETESKRQPKLSKEKRSKIIEITKKLPEDTGAPVLGSKLEILKDAKDILDLFSED